jgi:hypothetical protein
MGVCVDVCCWSVCGGVDMNMKRGVALVFAVVCLAVAAFIMYQSWPM